MSTYAFVDGSSLISLIESAREYFDIEADAKFDFGSFFNVEADSASRTFFYDAFPDKKPSSDPAAYEQTLEGTQERFDRINAYPGIHVKNGVARFRPKRGQEQKGVDILLAIDVYRQAVNGLERAFIFANDGDFYPVLEALQGTQTRSILKCIRGKTPKYLYELADVVSYINELNIVTHFETERGIEKWYRVSPRTDMSTQSVRDQGNVLQLTIRFDDGTSYDVITKPNADFYLAQGGHVHFQARKLKAFVKYMEREFGMLPVNKWDGSSASSASV